MNDIIAEDINNLITYLYFQYDSKYSLEFLLKRYTPNISIEKNSVESKKKKIIKFKKKNSIPSNENRCKARCWGGLESVKYDPINKKWYYGKQCVRHKSHREYCLTHYKQSISSYGLHQGNIDEEPPHPHYLKYKNKIESKFNIKY
jgi:hypothetical protein